MTLNASLTLNEDLGAAATGIYDIRGAGAKRKLGELCAARLHERYAATAMHAEADARLTQELNVIDRLGLAGFFLLHHEMLELPRSIWRNGIST